MRQKWVDLVVLLAVCAGWAGCRSAKPPVAEPTQPKATPAASGQAPIATAAAPHPQANDPRPDKPRPYERALVDQDATAGVRGTQIVDFVVTENGKPVEGARVTVVNAKGKPEGDGKTSDWGEFHAGLETGKYKVRVEQDGKSLVKQVTVDEGTSRVDLELDDPEP